MISTMLMNKNHKNQSSKSHLHWLNDDAIHDINDHFQKIQPNRNNKRHNGNKIIRKFNNNNNNINVNNHWRLRMHRHRTHWKRTQRHNPINRQRTECRCFSFDCIIYNANRRISEKNRLNSNARDSAVVPKYFVVIAIQPVI